MIFFPRQRFLRGKKQVNRLKVDRLKGFYVEIILEVPSAFSLQSDSLNPNMK